MLLPLIIEELAISAINYGSSSPRFADVCEIAVSVNSINFQGKLLHRLRRVSGVPHSRGFAGDIREKSVNADMGKIRQAIARTTSQPVAMIADSPEWPEITALIRMEMSISFSAHLQSQLYLPDVLHIVTMLVGTGSASHRSAIYSMVVNMVSCLCSLQGSNPESSTLYAILKRLGQPSTQVLFGLYANELTMRCTEDEFAVREPISSIALESIVQLLIEVVKIASPATGTCVCYCNILQGHFGITCQINSLFFATRYGEPVEVEMG